MFRARTLRNTSALFYKRLKKIVPRALLSYISTWKFLRTLEKCEKHRALYNLTMHSVRFFISFIYVTSG